MRFLTALAIPIALLILTGCSMHRNNRNTAQRSQATDVEQIIGYWNANSQKINSVLCDSVHVIGDTQGQPIKVKAKLGYQRPNRFRMTGAFAGSSEVDLGSNEKEVWYWIRRGDPPALYYCDRRDLPNVQQPLPFHPDWIIEVLGVTQLDPKAYRIEQRGPDGITMLSHQTTPTGQPVTKRVWVDPRTSRVSGYGLYTADNRQIVTATVKDYYDDPQTGAFLPRSVRLEWPDERTTVNIMMTQRHMQLNSIGEEFASHVFRLDKTIYEHSKQVNLAALGGPARRIRIPQQHEGGFSDGLSPTPYGSGVRQTGAAVRLSGEIEPVRNQRNRGGSN